MEMGGVKNGNTGRKLGKMVTIPRAVLLNTNGETSIPLVGLGTASFPFGESKGIVKQAILDAIEAGYRHLDTAAAYQTEVPLGEAISEALSCGLIKSRDELFITSKLLPGFAHRHLVVPAIQKSLKNLGLDYLDLYLIHFPVSLKPGLLYGFNKDEIEAIDIKSVWQGMEECQSIGLAKSIGVSNFTCTKLEVLLCNAKIAPAVNQVEMSPLWQQKKLRKFCDEKGIHLTAFSPLGAKGTPWGNPVMDSEVLSQIAETKGKTVAQVCLRWAFEQGVSMVVKSFNKERMRSNIEIFDWNLDEEDLQKIDGIPQKRGNDLRIYVSDQGPYKSVADIWDGEI